jgi:biotin carboxyl carrier protein
MEYRYDINGEERVVTIDGSGESMVATLDGKAHSIWVAPAGDNCILLKVDGYSYPVRYARDEQGLHVMVKGLGLVACQPGENSGAMGDFVELVDGKQIIVAPMPGQVVKVNVNLGDKVSKKQCMVIVEAMKMENELNVAVDGTVTAIHVSAGQKVDALQALVEVTQEEKH